MDRYKTRARANTGRRIMLRDPATGLETEDWLLVRNRWCDEFQEAQARAMQQAFLDARNGEKAASEAKRFGLVTALVAGWSFDEPFTAEACEAFLREAPQIVDQIDRLATDDGFFFRSEPAAS